jgi:hypothetical protein
MDRWGDRSYSSTGFIVEKWSCAGDPQQESWSTPSANRLKFFIRWVEVPGKSLDATILNDPLTFLR